MIELVQAAVEGLFHFLSVAAAADRNAFCEIAEDCEHYIPLEICALREIPGRLVEPDCISPQRGHGVGQDNRIDHRQVVGADKPGSPVLRQMIFNGPPSGPKVPDAVPQRFQRGIHQRHRYEDKEASQNVLEMKQCFLPLIHRKLLTAIPDDSYSFLCNRTSVKKVSP